MLEFALVAFLFIPVLMGSFVTGMNLIRSIQVNEVCRDLADIYIHGGDFSTYSMQQLAQRLATGLGLQIGSSFTGNSNSNTGNSGNGLITVTQMEYVGPTTGSLCTSVGAGNCVNHDSYVYLERIQFGNSTLASATTVTLGTPTTGITISSAGVVQNPLTDSHAKIPDPAQTSMVNMWSDSNNGTAALVDGQVVYIVETYFQSPDLALGSLSGQGVYARYFF